MAGKRQVHQKLLEKKQHQQEDKEEPVLDMDEDSESVTKGTKRLREAEGMYVCVLIFIYHRSTTTCHKEETEEL